jgi:hypothetical protein
MDTVVDATVSTSSSPSPAVTPDGTVTVAVFTVALVLRSPTKVIGCAVMVVVAEAVPPSLPVTVSVAV